MDLRDSRAHNEYEASRNLLLIRRNRETGKVRFDLGRI